MEENFWNDETIESFVIGMWHGSHRKDLIFRKPHKPNKIEIKMAIESFRHQSEEKSKPSIDFKIPSNFKEIFEKYGDKPPITQDSKPYRILSYKHRRKTWFQDYKLNNDFEIWNVLRYSDWEIFTVGDYTDFGKIKGFKLVENIPEHMGIVFENGEIANLDRVNKKENKCEIGETKVSIYLTYEQRNILMEIIRQYH